MSCFRNLAFLVPPGPSFGFTALREALSFWLPTHLVEAAHFAAGAASVHSALYSELRVVSMFGTDYLSDATLQGRAVATGGCSRAGVDAATNGAARQRTTAERGRRPATTRVLLVSGRGHDLAYRRVTATASGLVRAVSYAGSTVALWLAARLAGLRGVGRRNGGARVGSRLHPETSGVGASRGGRVKLLLPYRKIYTTIR